jgi:hypothetical protein
MSTSTNYKFAHRLCGSAIDFVGNAFNFRDFVPTPVSEVFRRAGFFITRTNCSKYLKDHHQVSKLSLLRSHRESRSSDRRLQTRTRSTGVPPVSGELKLQNRRRRAICFSPNRQFLCQASAFSECRYICCDRKNLFRGLMNSPFPAPFDTGETPVLPKNLLALSSGLLQ